MPNNITTLISEKQIQNRLKTLAKKIKKDNKDISAIVVLNGAIVGFYDLARELYKNNCNIESVNFVKISSYQGTKNKKINFEFDAIRNIEDKNVVIFEDIVDTGNTLSFFTQYLMKNKKARSVKIFSLLDKPSARIKPIKIDYVGFTVPDKFVVGYGLDYNQKYRELPFIGTIN